MAENGKLLPHPKTKTNRNKKMKTPLIINVGLNDNSNQEINVHQVCNTLASHGFNILASRVFDSPAGNEKCLVACVQSTLSEVECNARLYCVASCLRQDCIAVVESGLGKLIGPESEKWGEFNPAFFVTLSGLTLAEGLPFEASKPATARERDNCAASFISYLESILIPDLRADDQIRTADDFETLIAYYRNK